MYNAQIFGLFKFNAQAYWIKAPQMRYHTMWHVDLIFLSVEEINVLTKCEKNLDGICIMLKSLAYLNLMLKLIGL